MSKIIWLDQKVNNEENKKFVKELEELGYKNMKLFKKVNEAIEYMKSIQFEETKIIVNERLFSEFINIFKINIKDIFIAPKIIIYTSKKESFFECNKEEYEKNENKFYTFGGIIIKKSEIKDFFKKEKIINVNNTSQKNKKVTNMKIASLNTQKETKETKNNFNVQLTFEYIDSKDKLLLPMFFKSLIDSISNENIEEYTKSLYNIFYL